MLLKPSFQSSFARFGQNIKNGPEDPSAISLLHQTETRGQEKRLGFIIMSLWIV